MLVLVAAGRLRAQQRRRAHGPRAGRGARGRRTQAIAGIRPPVELRRLRLRQAAGRHFVDVVIGVPSDAAVGQGHAAADAVESALERALPESDVVVHVEPLAEGSALPTASRRPRSSVPRVREVHNISVVDVDGRPDISLHLKLPGDDVARRGARGRRPRSRTRSTRRCPKRGRCRRTSSRSAEAVGRRAQDGAIDARGEADRPRATGSAPREVRFVETDGRLVAYVTVGLDAGTPLADAHGRASEIEEQIAASSRRSRTSSSDTEP